MAVGVGIALFDLTGMLLQHDIWRNVKSQQDRLAFGEKINAIVPAQTQLFATPDLDNFVLIVIAYRLGREIHRKPITCGSRSNYFLSSLDQRNRSDMESRVLASSEIERIAVIIPLPGKPSDYDQGCIGSHLRLAPDGDT